MLREHERTQHGPAVGRPAWRQTGAVARRCCGLHRPGQKPGRCQKRPVGFVRERHMQARGAQLFAKRQGPAQQHLSALIRVDIRPDQQPWSCCRRKGRSALQLGIIAPAGPLIGIGPGPVEDVFALAMAFQIERHDRCDLSGLVFDGQVMRRPARPVRRTAARFQNVQEVEADKGIAAAGAGIPCRLSDIGDPAVNSNRGCQAHALKPSKITLSQ